MFQNIETQYVYLCLSTEGNDLKQLIVCLILLFKDLSNSRQVVNSGVMPLLIVQVLIILLYVNPL